MLRLLIVAAILAAFAFVAPHAGAAPLDQRGTGHPGVGHPGGNWGHNHPGFRPGIGFRPGFGGGFIRPPVVIAGVGVPFLPPPALLPPPVALPIPVGVPVAQPVGVPVGVPQPVALPQYAPQYAPQYTPALPANPCGCPPQ